MEMNEIHDAVWEFLIKKNQQNPDLRFILRSGNRHERLEKGYWFYGNDDYLTVSFWNAFNNVGKNIPDDARSPIISFIISQNGKCNLRFYYETNSTTIPLFEDLSKALGMEKNELHEKTVKVTETKSWSKNYNKLNGNKTPQYLDYLEYFLSFEKPVIDAFLRVHDEQKVLFPDIDAKKFRESIQSIERWRATQNIGSYKNLNDALQNALKPSVLILKNIGRFDELRIDFSKQVTCFIGNNGCGKSTILKALALSFTGVYPFKQERNGLPPNEKYILKLKNLLRINKAGTKSHYSSSGLIELYYNVNTIDTHNRIT